MRYACPACAAPLRLSDDLPPGKRLRCPKCKEPFAVPAAKPGAAEARAAASRRAAPSEEDIDQPRRVRSTSGKRRFKPKKRQSNLVPVFAIGTVGLVLLGGAALGIGWWFSRNVTPTEASAPPVVQKTTSAPEPAPLPPVNTKAPAPAPAPVVATGGTPDIAPPPFVGKGALAESAPSSPKMGLNVGDLAPDIEGEDIDGKPFKLADYRGKVVVLDFWGHW